MTSVLGQYTAALLSRNLRAEWWAAGWLPHPDCVTCLVPVEQLDPVGTLVHKEKQRSRQGIFVHPKKLSHVFSFFVSELVLHRLACASLLAHCATLAAVPINAAFTLLME